MDGTRDRYARRVFLYSRSGVRRKQCIASSGNLARALSLLFFRLARASRSPRALSARRPAPSSRRWSRRPPCRAERRRGGARLDFRETRIDRTGRRNSVFASPLSFLGTQIRGTPRDLIRVRERAGEAGGGAGRATYVLRGLVGVDSRAVEQEAHGIGLQRLARAEGVEDLAGR